MKKPVIIVIPEIPTIWPDKLPKIPLPNERQSNDREDSSDKE